MQGLQPLVVVGLQPGDALLRLGDVATTNPQTFGVTFRSRYRAAEGQPIDVVWRRGGQEMTIEQIQAAMLCLL